MTKILGQRKLTQDEFDRINKVKESAAPIGELCDEMLEAGADPRMVALAKTNLQQGFMWLNRAIAKNTVFG